jgi:diguanylate cyclase (GGDEF)-like protein
MSPMSPMGPLGPLGPLGPMARLTTIGVVTTLCSLGALLAVDGHPPTGRAAPSWAVALVALGYLVAERVVLLVQVRLHAVAIALVEVPTACALVFLDGRLAVALRVVVGALTALPRRPPLHKMLFNSCVHLSETVVALAVFRVALADDLAPSRVALAVLLATLTMQATSTVLVSAAIAQFAGGFRQRLAQSVRSQWWVAPLSGMYAASTVTAALVSPWLTLLVLAPIAGMWWVLGQHSELRRQFLDLEGVHGFAADIAEVIDLARMIEVATAGAAELLHARQAALVLSASGVIIDTAEHGGPMPGLPATVDELHSLVRHHTEAGRLVARPRADGSLSALVRGDDGELGMLVVLGREGATTTFDAADARRLQGVADQLATAVGRGLLHRRLERAAQHDALTGLVNRPTLESTLAAACVDGSATGRFVVMFDLDRFKEVNDTLGHHAGDVLLVEFSRRVSGLLELGDVLARFAGDEFVLTGSRDDLAAVEAFVRRCTEAALAPFVLDGLQVVVAVSAGIAWRDEDVAPAEMIRRADVAMYHAKSQHLGYAVHTSEIDRRTPARLSLLTDLRTAIQRDEIQLHFQPEIDVASGRVRGVEALARWYHPERGWVAPSDFVKVAEESGLIRSLTDIVVERGLAALARLHARGHRIGIALNLSTQDLFDELLGDRIERRLDEHAIEPQLVTIEITEGSLLVDGPRTRSTIARLDRIGVQLSIDDFGTGYSSLSYLRKLPVRELKIDRSFVTGLLGATQDEVIVRSTIDLGHNLGMRVVAEGVEQQAVLDRLSELGCDVAQGFGIARPMPLDDLFRWLDTRSGAPIASEAPSVAPR